MKIGVLNKSILFVSIVSIYRKTPFPFGKTGLQISPFITHVISLHGKFATGRQLGTG